MILVTGGTGLVGSHLLYNLVHSGKQVLAIKRPTSVIRKTEQLFSWYHPQGRDLFQNIVWIDADLLDVYALKEVMHNITQVYHCAAQVSFLPQEANQLMKYNAEGTANLVNVCLESGIQKLCYVSSVAALGKEPHGKLITETTSWKTSSENSSYAISKYRAECEVWRGAEEGLPVVIVNPSVILGPGDWNRSSGKIIQTAFNGLKWYTSGVTGFVDVRDVAGIMIQLMDSSIVNERFILNAENTSFRELFNDLCDCLHIPKPGWNASPTLGEIGWRLEKIKCAITGNEPLITKETARAANQKSYFSSEKIKNRLNIDFIPIKKSIVDTCELFLKQQTDR